MTYAPAPVPPQNNRRTLRIVLIVVSIVVAICCVGGAVGGWFLYRTVKETLGPAHDTVATYLEALHKGDHQGAYDQLCQPRRNDVTLAEFSRQREALPKLVAYEITGLNVSNTNGRTGGTARVRLETEVGDETTQVISLVKEDGGWRVCS